MSKIPQRLPIVGLMFLCFAINYTAASEPNSSRTTAESQRSALSEKENGKDLNEMIIGRLDVMFGFILGLFGTIFVDYMRRRGRVKDLRDGVRTELRQVLGIVNLLTFNPDAKLSVEKIRSMQELYKEFDLHKVLNPLSEVGTSEEFQNVVNREFTDDDFQQLVKVRESQLHQRMGTGNYQGFKKLQYSFLKSNMSSIPLLNRHNQALVIEIIRRIEVFNDMVPRQNFCLEKSYDSSVTSENHERLRATYYRNCQFISDWAHDTAKIIAHFLRQTAVGARHCEN